jgi:hypothetical protein
MRDVTILGRLGPDRDTHLRQSVLKFVEFRFPLAALSEAAMKTRFPTIEHDP